MRRGLHSEIVLCSCQKDLAPLLLLKADKGAVITNDRCGNQRSPGVGAAEPGTCAEHRV